MLKSWLTAVAAVLVAVAPAWAQTAQEKTGTNVEVRSGVVVIKKTVRNGEVINENVEVFGDLDDEIRERILAMAKVCKPRAKKEKKSDVTPAKPYPKLRSKKKGSCGGVYIVGPDDEEHVFSIGPDDEDKVFSIGPGFQLKLDSKAIPSGKALKEYLEKARKAWAKHGGAAGFSFGFPDGEALQKKIQKEVEKALKNFHHEHGINIPYPGSDLLKSLQIKKFSSGPHTLRVVPGSGGVFTLQKDGDKDRAAPARARIRVEINGQEVLDKAFETGKPEVKVYKYKYVPGKTIQGKAVPGTIIIGKTGKTVVPAPRAQVKILRKKKADTRPSSTEATIQRLEQTIERLQRDLEKLKQDLGGVKPSPRTQPVRARRI
jgi:hypothetical protein